MAAQRPTASSRRPLLCLCLTAPTIQGDLAILKDYGGWADIAELRVDCLSAEERAHAARLPSLTALPVILTVRRTADGGFFSGSEADRVRLLSSLVGAGFTHVDLEEDLSAPALDRASEAAGLRVIRSLHDPAGVPADLHARLERLARSPGEIPKAAVTPRSSTDLDRLLRTVESVEGRERIVLGMGEAGFCTRVLAGKIGSMLSYASAPGMAAAPGHTDPRTLAELYRFRLISPRTQVYGVMGNPVSHSLSPLIHNRGLAALGVDAVYVPFLVDDPAAFLPAAELIGVGGLSVTIPHKQAVLPLLGASDGPVEAAGACNTMWKTEKGWAGTNTDIEGFLQPLRRAFGGAVPAALSAVVLGAGGAARGVMAALSSLSARVLVLNRNRERARDLAASFGAEWGSLDASGAARATGAALIVNTTRVGMGDSADQEPLPSYAFSGREVVYDLAYGRKETAFLSRARAAGCRTISGEEMLLAQAYLQFRTFTGREFPSDVKEELESAARSGGLAGA